MCSFSASGSHCYINITDCVNSPGGKGTVLFFPALVLSLEVVEKNVFSCVGQLVVGYCQSAVDHGRFPLPINVCSTCV